MAYPCGVQAPLTLYTKQDAPRLRYVLDWMLGSVLGIPYSLTDDPAAPVQLAYGAVRPGAVCIPDSGLLWQRGISSYELPEKPPVVDDGAFSADILSAAFFLLSRMEEWGPFEADRHGRFPAAQSALARRGWLQRPVVDEWIEVLRVALNDRCGLGIPKPAFRFQPTYDIDIAYSYLHKGAQRTVGGLLRDAKAGNLAAVRHRLKTLTGTRPDPYDAYAFLRQLHQTARLTPRYFVLAAAQPGPFDKNTDPRHPAMRALVQGFGMEGSVGMHPSYGSSEQPALLQAEKAWLEHLLKTPVTQSRQHYIRLRLPDTYRALLAAGITGDWSMGFPDAAGFRAGTGRPFPWYDLDREAPVGLRIHPFAFMDATARDYAGLDATAAFAQLQEIRDALHASGSVLTTIFHNFSLGTDRDWPGWRKGYADFVQRSPPAP